MKVYGVRYDGDWVAVEIDTRKAFLKVNKLWRMRTVFIMIIIIQLNIYIQQLKKALKSINSPVSPIYLFDEDFGEVYYV